MNIRGRGFNLNLALVLAVAVAGGCRTKEARQEKIVSTLRVHLEAPQDRSDRAHQVPVYRASPVMVNIEASPFLTEADVSEARLVETIGGFGIRIAFAHQGRFLLENVTGSNRGKRYAVFSQFASALDPGVNQSRWLAAPVINARVTNGVSSSLPTPPARRLTRLSSA